MVGPRKIVYLFGAGATHAELANLVPDPQDPKFEKKEGLLIRQVSDRVIEEAKKDKDYIRGIEAVTSASGEPNIELLISLIESSRIEGAPEKTARLKALVKNDIETILVKNKPSAFYLQRALLELYTRKKVLLKESLLGLLSLNYDSTLDQAYKTVFKRKPNYSFTENDDTGIPLLKLHGSFGWQGVQIRSRRRNIEILPLGSSKNYLHVPYNFIWTKALDLLSQCDIVRVIGCSLSPNDFHLIDLLFKAHLEKGSPFTIQIISNTRTGDAIRSNYGFFPQIETLFQIEPPLIPGPDREFISPFKTWLYYKSRDMLQTSIRSTRFLRRLTSI